MKNSRQRAEAHRQAGLKAMQAKRWPAAIAEFERGTALSPHDALLRLNLARAHMQCGALDRAVAEGRETLRLDPASPVACRLVGECLLQQNRVQEAAAVFDQYPADAARDHDWFNAYGNALFQAQRLQDAVGVFFQALALKIDAPLVHYRLGLCFKDLGMTRESTECFRTAVSLDSGAVRALALSLLVHESRQTCDWSLVEEDTAQLLKALDQGDDQTGQKLSPFALLAVDATPEQQRRIGALRLRGLTPGLKPMPPAGPRRPGRIRVGYLSCDFHQHATSVLMAELLERRDSERFEVTLYSHSPDDGSEIGKRVRAACDHFVDVTHCSNADVARRMRADDIDIAIDLKGHTRGSRFELLAFKPARVSAAFLGYPATTGADFIDYMIGDPVVLPLAQAGQYSEHLAQLPNSYQPNDRRRALPPAPTRAQAGLPDDAVVFCCFNQTYKISPHMLDLWARILHGAPNAVLWMLAWNPHAQANLERELAARGVGQERVFWAPKLPLSKHIARLRVADMFLDTWPCNAHTTASEALWAGVPVLTVPGATFASRVAASLVTACGLPDLAAPDEDGYVNLAIALAQESATLQGLKEHLDTQRMNLPLFDSDRYARDYETLLQRMFDREQAGLPPAHLLAATA
ncbi:MAG TPA: tetratricopeptide repeat protein [Ideonella sp.]|uniref:O-linked N-acetylglucosamine transferase, SPINDLY family protein n=1 Tax=Ideonella sp. TaxID=1929293 RepID=UPI002E34D133|nr:tetratricopeptide repeat protein [Ideonella sp.]HEX5686279.1 tetratricopeptide repeat protein [Ideonella sp.]